MCDSLPCVIPELVKWLSDAPRPLEIVGKLVPLAAAALRHVDGSKDSVTVQQTRLAYADTLVCGFYHRD